MVLKPDLKKRVLTFLKQGAGAGSEALVAILSVLACFAILQFGLKLIFPEGDSTQFWFLRNSDSDPSLPSHPLPGERGKIEVSLSDETTEGQDEVSELAARLTFTQNEVKNKRSDEIAWSTARAGLDLFNRDAVQTLSRSRAIVTFDPRNYLDMDENSLVVIKKMEQNKTAKEKNSFIVVIDGSLRGRIDGSGAGNVQVKIATPNALAEINARETRDRLADFQVHVNPDQTSTLTVYDGVARVTAQGTTVEVKSNQSTRIGLAGAPETPRTILGPVSLVSPGENHPFYYRDFPPEITFSWSRQEEAVLYHLQIARDGTFRDRILDEYSFQPEFLYGNLKRGNYFWRISPLDAGRIEGQWSESRRLEVVRDTAPPALKILFPQKETVINQETISVIGESDPHARVYINGEEVERKTNGRFTREIHLKKGINLILVESVDPAGNTSFQKKVISRKY